MTAEPSAHSPTLRDPNDLKARVAALLTEIQFEGDSSHCPSCGAYKNPGEHEPDCELAKLLKECS